MNVKTGKWPYPSEGAEFKSTVIFSSNFGTEDVFQLNELVSYILLKCCSLNQLVKWCWVCFLFLKILLGWEKELGLWFSLIALAMLLFTLQCPAFESEESLWFFAVVLQSHSPCGLAACKGFSSVFNTPFHWSYLFFLSSRQYFAYLKKMQYSVENVGENTTIYFLYLSFWGFLKNGGMWKQSRRNTVWFSFLSYHAIFDINRYFRHKLFKMPMIHS